MSLNLRWLGHGGWMVSTGKHTILIDPFLSENPKAPLACEEVPADFILVSHGHFDHIADVPAIAKRTRAQVVAVYDVVQWLAANHGVENSLGMNIGGSARLPFGQVKLTPAWHSSQLPDGSYGGTPVGFLLTIEGVRSYFACDTALFSDMQLFATPPLDVAVLPIGDLFTMGPEDGVAAVRLLKPRFVVPSHYGTWPPIEQDASAWAEQVRRTTASTPIILQPGESFDVA
jgi:L-ascorbate metabolism protein UlaG (beta-lactamase superfamily)